MAEFWSAATGFVPGETPWTSVTPAAREPSSLRAASFWQLTGARHDGCR
jgi:hypothetical protein